MATISDTRTPNAPYRERPAIAGGAVTHAGANRMLGQPLTHGTRPRFVARLAARVRGPALDRALITGVDLVPSSQLAARAAYLTSHRVRNELADTLERRADMVDDGVVHTHRVIRPSLGAVRQSREKLRELAALLRGPKPLHARGIAKLRLLVTDGTGPLYARDGGRALASELRNARAALVG